VPVTVPVATQRSQHQPHCRRLNTTARRGGGRAKFRNGEPVPGAPKGAGTVRRMATPELLRPRWVAGHVLVVTLVGVFVALGFWQLGRHRETQRQEKAQEAAASAPSVTGPDVLATGPDAAARRTTVQASGTYAADRQVVVRNRVRGDEVGVDVLTPLVLADGRAVLVDRGFLPGSDDAVVPVPPDPPGGTVRVSGEARPSQTVVGDEAAEPEGGVVDRIVLDRLGQALDLPLLPVWIAMVAQDPPPAPGQPLPAVAPVGAPPSEVNHLNYAIQWFAFAAIPLLGWPILLARARRRRGDTDPTPVAPPVRPPARAGGPSR